MLSHFASSFAALFLFVMALIGGGEVGTVRLLNAGVMVELQKRHTIILVGGPALLAYTPYVRASFTTRLTLR